MQWNKGARINSGCMVTFQINHIHIKHIPGLDIFALHYLSCNRETVRVISDLDMTVNVKVIIAQSYARFKYKMMTQQVKWLNACNKMEAFL